MILLYINNLQLEKGVTHISTDWEISDNTKFDSPAFSSYNDETNRDMIVWNSVLDPTTTWYARARVLLSTGYTVWGNVDIIDVTDETVINVSDSLPSRISTPIITTNSDVNAHDTTLFTITATGFGTVGDSTHSSTTWLIEDVNSEVVYASIKDENNLTSFTLKNLVLEDYTVYRFKAIFHSTSNDVSPVGSLTIVTSDSSSIVLDPTINFVDATQDLTLNILSIDNITTVNWKVYSQKDNVLTSVYETSTSDSDILTTTIPAYTMPSDTSMLLEISVDNDNVGKKYVVFRTYEYDEEEKDTSDLIVDERTLPETEYATNEDATYVEEVDWTYLVRDNTQDGVEAIITNFQETVAAMLGLSSVDIFTELTDDMKQCLYYVVRLYDNDSTRYELIPMNMFTRLTETYFPSTGNSLSSTFTYSYVPGLVSHMINCFDMSTYTDLPSGYNEMTASELQSYFREKLISDIYSCKSITVTEKDINYAVMWLRPYCIIENLNDDVQPTNYTETDVDANTFYKTYFNFYNTIYNTNSIMGGLITNTISGIYCKSSVAVFHTLRSTVRYLWKLATTSSNITEDEVNYINGLNMSSILEIVKKSYDKENGYYEIDNDYILAEEGVNDYEKAYFLVKTYVDNTQEIIVNPRYELDTVTDAGYNNLISYVASICSSSGLGSTFATTTQLDIARYVFGVVGNDVGYPTFIENLNTYSSEVTSVSSIPSVTEDDIEDEDLDVSRINAIIQGICSQEYYSTDSKDPEAFDLTNLDSKDLNYIYLRTRLHDIDTINYPCDSDKFEFVYYDHNDKYLSNDTQEYYYSHGYSYNVYSSLSGTSISTLRKTLPLTNYQTLQTQLANDFTEDEYRFAINWLRPYLYEIQYNSYGQDTTYDETTLVPSDMKRFANYKNTTTLYNAFSSSSYVPFVGSRNLVIFLTKMLADSTNKSLITSSNQQFIKQLDTSTILSVVKNAFNKTEGYIELPSTAHIYNVVDSLNNKYDDTEPERLLYVVVADASNMDTATSVTINPMFTTAWSTYFYNSSYTLDTIKINMLGYFGEHDYAELGVNFSFGISQVIVEVNSYVTLNITTNANEWSVSFENDGYATFYKSNGFIVGNSVGLTNMIATAEGETFSIPVTVVAQGDGISGIKVTTQPSKVDYSEGEVFDPTGMVVIVYTNTGTEIELSDGMWSYTPTEALTRNDTEITITYNNFTTTVPITVIEATIAYLQVVSQPDKTAYFVDEEVDLSGAVIQAVYTNGDIITLNKYSTNSIDGYTYSPSTITENTTEIIITYENNTISIPVTTLINISTYKVTSENSLNTVALGSQLQLVLDYTPTNATIVKSSWTLNSSIDGVSIDSNGLISVDANANYTSTALIATCAFTAYQNDTKVSLSNNKSIGLLYPTTTGSFTFSLSSVTLETGNSTTLEIIFPSNIISFSSDNYTVDDITQYLFVYETNNNIASYDYLTSKISTNNNSMSVEITAIQQGTTDLTFIYSNGTIFLTGTITCTNTDYENSWIGY